MSLDPQAERVLERLARLGQPPLQQQSPSEARENMLLGVIGLGNPPSVAVVTDHQVAVDGGKIGLRLYKSQTDNDALPVLIYYHGGGWVIGGIATHDILCRHLALATGWAVASVDYRLAPEFPFPTPLEDCLLSVIWIEEHAETLGLDVARRVVCGDSAGGNLAACVAARVAVTHPRALCGQVLIYPITDHDFETPSYREKATGYGLTRDAMRWFWDHYLPDVIARDQPDASPLRADDLSGLPPALVMTAEYDPLCSEGEAYAQRLEASGVPTRLLRYEGQIHGFLRMTNQVDRAREGLHDIAVWLRELD